jgi:acetyl-CoA synthetase
MLQAVTSYDALCKSFVWDIPKRYNMGVDVCDKWAVQDPNRTAIIDLTDIERRDVSFGELQRLSNKLALHLQSLGVTVGDRVGVLRSQSVWTAAAHIAIWKLGAISMPLFSLFRSEALLSRLENSGASVVIVDERSGDQIAPLQCKLPKLRDIICPETTDFNCEDTDFEVCNTLADDPAILIYTSGTTGPPKGAL